MIFKRTSDQKRVTKELERPYKGNDPCQAAMEYTVRSPLMFFKYFEEIDDTVPVPATFEQVDTFNKFAKAEDLAQYVDDDLKGVITSITFEAEDVHEWTKDLPTYLDLLAHVKTTRELTDDEKQEVIDFLMGQYSDGWMENGFDVKGGTFQAYWDYYDTETELTFD